MAIFDGNYSDSFYFLTYDDQELHPIMQKNQDTGCLSFRVGQAGSARTLNHPDPKKCALEVDESAMFDYVINQQYFTRFKIVKDDKFQINYRYIHSKDIKAVVIHDDWLHLKK